jgi:hypothetical protein
MLYSTLHYLRLSSLLAPDNISVSFEFLAMRYR